MFYLARMLLDAVIGQRETFESLKQLLDNNRLSHALLFLGREGSGGLALAKAFAQYILCAPKAAAPAAVGLFGEEPVATAPKNRPCGECPGCIKVQQLIHPDLHFSFPVVTKKAGSPPLSNDYMTEWREFHDKQPYGNAYDWLQFIGAENKQGNITAHECNDILRKLSLKSFEGEYKILLMWMPEYLGEAGNKLLKLIEEPPANTLFILVAENESQILPTILSRTQMVKIPAIDAASIEAALVQKHQAQPQQAAQIAAVCEGNFHEALQLLSHAEDDWQSLLRDWLNACLKTGPSAQLKWVDEISKLGREKQKQFLLYFIHLLEQSLRMRVMDPAKVQLPEQEKDFAQRLNKIADLPQQEALVEELNSAIYYIERNANAKMLFMALTIKCYHIIGKREKLQRV
jgi:DNA polymerase III subunit delta'